MERPGESRSEANTSNSVSPLHSTLDASGSGVVSPTTEHQEAPSAHPRSEPDTIPGSRSPPANLGHERQTSPAYLPENPGNVTGALPANYLALWRNDNNLRLPPQRPAPALGQSHRSRPTPPPPPPLNPSGLPSYPSPGPPPPPSSSTCPTNPPNAPPLTHEDRTGAVGDDHDGGRTTQPSLDEDDHDLLEDVFPDRHNLNSPVAEATGSGGTTPTNANPLAPLISGLASMQIEDGISRHRMTRQVVGASTSVFPEPPSSPGGPTTFKWVRGEVIGKGRYGRVYIALNATTGEMIAVKQVERPRTPGDTSDNQRATADQALRIESETLKYLDHPHVVQYLGFEETAADLSLFLEYVPGGSIGSVLKKVGKFADVVTRSFTWQILDGLEYLHSKGIMHRDLKSDKILVEMTGTCKIAGFGASERTGDNEGDRHNAVRGTLFWMAPEVINTSAGPYSLKIDIWSVGCVVLEMWSGMRPWAAEEMVPVMFKLHQGELPPVLENMNLSEFATNFRLQCFAVDPNERPSASQLKEHPYLELPRNWCFKGFTTWDYGADF